MPPSAKEQSGIGAFRFALPLLVLIQPLVPAVLYVPGQYSRGFFGVARKDRLQDVAVIAINPLERPPVMPGVTSGENTDCLPDLTDDSDNALVACQARKRHVKCDIGSLKTLHLLFIQTGTPGCFQGSHQSGELLGHALQPFAIDVSQGAGGETSDDMEFESFPKVVQVGDIRMTQPGNDMLRGQEFPRADPPRQAGVWLREWGCG